MNRYIESVHEGKESFKCNVCDTSFSQMHCGYSQGYSLGYSVFMLDYNLAKITLTTKFTFAKNL